MSELPPDSEDAAWAQRAASARQDPTVNAGNLGKVAGAGGKFSDAFAENAGGVDAAVAAAQGGSPTQNDFFTYNPEFLFSRRARDLIDLLIDPRRQVDRECGYPVAPDQYLFHMLYERDPIAGRVVKCLPEESWKKNPIVYEKLNSAWETPVTPFEKAWKELAKRVNIWHETSLIDEVSGIGHFGVLLLGVDDNMPLSVPLEGVSETGERVGSKKPLRLLYLRGFEETVCRVKTRQADRNNPRFGKPILYTLMFQDADFADVGSVPQQGTGMTTQTVHWSRVIHVADNRISSRVYGQPRIMPVLNPILDMRKVRGGGAEGYWRGAFQGHALELAPGVSVDDVDKESIKKQYEQYGNSQQRYLMLAGLTVKPLPPQLSDPQPHREGLKEDIAIRLGIPMRILYGSERGELASSQDSDSWIDRIVGRQTNYLTPMVVCELVDRLIDIGVLPAPVEYYVEWPDLNATTKKDRAPVALANTQALVAYANSDAAANVVPENEFLSHFLELDQNVVEEIAAAREDAEAEEQKEGEEESDADEDEPLEGLDAEQETSLDVGSGAILEAP